MFNIYVALRIWLLRKVVDIFLKNETGHSVVCQLCLERERESVIETPPHQKKKKLARKIEPQDIYAF